MTARTTEVARNLCSDFLRDADRFRDSVSAHKKRPGRQTIRPGLRHSAPRIVGSSAVCAAFRNEGLLDVASGLVASNLTVEDVRETSLGVLPLIHTERATPGVARKGVSNFCRWRCEK